MDILPSLFGGIIGLIVLVFLVAIGVYWLLFPWFVYTKLDKIIGHLKAIEKGQSPEIVEIKDTATKGPKLPPLPGKERYHVSANDVIGGPYTLDVIEGLVSRGTLTKADYALLEGGAKWERIDALFEIT